MINEKYVRKYMRLAKIVGEDSCPCYSRSIGTVIVDPLTNTVLSTGFNGPPVGTPHTDTKEYLEMLWNTLMTKEDKEFVNFENCHDFIKKYEGQKTCPRRILGIPSGQKLTYCSCGHSEQNACVRSGRSLFGSWLFCWCGVPCVDCAKVIINVGIRRVHCLKIDVEDYSPQSRWLFNHANIPLTEMEAIELNV